MATDNNLSLLYSIHQTREEALKAVKNGADHASYMDGFAEYCFWRDRLGSIWLRHVGPDGTNFGDRIIYKKK